MLPIGSGTLGVRFNHRLSRLQELDEKTEVIPTLRIMSIIRKIIGDGVQQVVSVEWLPRFAVGPNIFYFYISHLANPPT